MQPIIKMKKFLYIVLFLFAGTQTNAQLHEIGVFGGGSNFIGDVGKTNYIAPNKLTLGLLYKWNKSKRHSWRFSAMTSKISGNDNDSNISSRKERGYQFENRITELSAGLEFNFFDFDLHKQPYFATPYLHTGLSYFRYENLYFETDQLKKEGRSSNFAIPITAGIKMKISNHFVLGLESGVRYTFVDDIDGSFPKNSSLDGLKFGNTNSNDWYVFSGATLTYTFGQNPCYCRN